MGAAYVFLPLDDNRHRQGQSFFAIGGGLSKERSNKAGLQ